MLVWQARGSGLHQPFISDSMFLDPKRYKRSDLTQDQMEFLVRLMPFGRLIQKMTWEKCGITRVPSVSGLCSSLIMADIILKSDWGTHRAARKENNLSLLEKTEYWKGRATEIDGVTYRSYSSWLDFSIDVTDEMTFYEKRRYEPLLSASNLDLQIDRLATLHPLDTTYSGRIEEVIEQYGLWEFDY